MEDVGGAEGAVGEVQEYDVQLEKGGGGHCDFVSAVHGENFQGLVSVLEDVIVFDQP